VLSLLLPSDKVDPLTFPGTPDTSYPNTVYASRRCETNKDDPSTCFDVRLDFKSNQDQLKAEFFVLSGTKKVFEYHQNYQLATEPFSLFSYQAAVPLDAKRNLFVRIKCEQPDESLARYKFHKVWEQDLSVAKQKAREKNQNILMFFTGSDWCKGCNEMEHNTLSLEFFRKAIEGKIILLEMNILKKDLRNSKHPTNLWRKRLGIVGVPNLVVVDYFGNKVEEVSTELTFPEKIQKIQSLGSKK
jgi:thioredoxin-related protein